MIERLLPSLKRQNAYWVNFYRNIPSIPILGSVRVTDTVDEGVEVSLHPRPQTPAPLGGDDRVKLGMQFLVTLK